MRQFVFQLVVHEGCDEFWESKPTPEDLQTILEDCLYNYGFHDDITVLNLVDYREGNVRWD